MYETERRSAISSSELGLYSDRADRYNRNNYGFIIRKFVIVVMAIVAVILAGIFIYDFAAGASASSKVSQETKHIYILQNALKKSNYLAKKTTTTTTTLTPFLPSDLQKRSDDDVQQLGFINNDDDNNNNDEKKRNFDTDLPEMRGQNLENFKLRKKLLQPIRDDEEDEEVEVKQTVNNHAVVYRVKQMYKPKDNEKETTEETRPAPFHFEFRAPRPEAFKRPKFPQLTQYRYPQSSKNIQDIIKYLSHDPDVTKRGIKFTGVYMNPQKYDRHSEIGETMSNTDQSEYSSHSQNSPEEEEEDVEENKEENNNENFQYSQQTIGDTFFPYKPRHPADVNLLAHPVNLVPSNVRFSQGINRHHPYIESYHHRPMLVKPQTQIEQSYETSALQSSNNGKKKKAKPKPFSVMLDIYPMTELNDQSTANNQKISSRPKAIINTDDYIDSRRPGGKYGRGGRFYPGNFAVPTQPIPLVATPTNDPTDDDEKQQMIFHLNLYPRKKNNKQNRNDAVQRSELIHEEDGQENLMKNIMLPFNTITKQLAVHSAIENAKFENNRETNDENAQQLEAKNYQKNELKINNDYERKKYQVSLNRKDDKIDNNNEIEKPESNDDKNNINNHNHNANVTVDTVENVQKYADGLVAMD